MIKYILIPAVCLGAVSPAMAEEPTDSVEGFVFTDVITIPCTSVKDQNKSGTCWCFCSTGFFENEVRRIGGDSLDLSEMLTVRRCYEAKADRYVRNYGQVNFSPGGSALDVAYVWKNFGVVPEDAYPGLSYGEDGHVHGELNDMMEAMLKVVKSKPNKKISTAWRPALEGVLDAYMGPVPETFTYKGKTYTPQSFAKSLGLDMDDYIGITSFTHHPFYESFILEIPDNWLNAEYMNVPLDEMKAIVDNALANGYTIAWAADVSEEGFKWYDGVALMPKEKTEADMQGTELSRWVKLSDKDRHAETFNFTGPVAEIEVTQDSRQAMFDSQETTDDHGMIIEGVATDQNGNRYYKVKNSWNTNQKYDGYIYVSEPYFLAKTMDIYVHKDAIPAAITKKFKK